MDKLWAICGRPVEQFNPSRMVGYGALHMPLIESPDRLFYRKPCIALSDVSKRTLYCVQNDTQNI